MHKTSQTRTRKHLKETNRFQTKTIKNGEKHAYEAPTANYFINIKSEKPRKSSEKLIVADKLKKPTKIKYITEEIEKSSHGPPTSRTKSCQRQRSGKVSPYNLEEDAYDAPSQYDQYDNRGQKDKNRHSGQNLNLGKVKARKGKSHSKEHYLNFKQPSNKNNYKQNKQTKNGGKNTLRTEKSPTNRQFLSPQIVKQENSYYFAEEPQYVRSARTQFLMPKKESKFIFESSRSYWHEQPHKEMVKSFLDLLN